eukprot:5956733-Prymnesium_polylepis.1
MAVRVPLHRLLLVGRLDVRLRCSGRHSEHAMRVVHVLCRREAASRSSEWRHRCGRRQAMEQRREQRCAEATNAEASGTEATSTEASGRCMDEHHGTWHQASD